MTTHLPTPPKFVNEYAELLSDKVGGRVLGCSDQWFAPCVNLIKHSAPIWDAEKFVDTGKWMDGWETKRHNPSFDWCVLKLGIPGTIVGIEIDTSYFTGNYPPYAQLESICVEGEPTLDQLLSDESRWNVVLQKSNLGSSCKQYFEPTTPVQKTTHLRFKIYPDGGVARLRVYGVAVRDWSLVIPGELVDLAAIENGGLVRDVSDQHYGNKNNIIMPGRSVNMGDGWETKRRRVPGNEWLIVRLGLPGSIKRIEVDTNWFKGNFPTSCSIEAINHADDQNLNDSKDWKPILPNTPLIGHNRHYFQTQLVNNQDAQLYTHVRLQIYPDGGVSRFRVHCKPLMY
ncbi:allantoicase [Tieghemostelium lacteum]|uniref:Allantoicase n=1 Tax=Tieghemostelium lacteum TaxID=361077 RepID=A0A151Z6H9_TIELA|nr:allantoicase [Tieghemostelium lacteum]|eukprot:KYQ89571.1 allantoicase [Tieghemostelium lacteum]